MFLKNKVIEKFWSFLPVSLVNPFFNTLPACTFIMILNFLKNIFHQWLFNIHITWCSLNQQKCFLKLFFDPCTYYYTLKQYFLRNIFHLPQHKYHLPRSNAIQDKTEKVWSLCSEKLSSLIYQKVWIGLIIIVLSVIPWWS